MMGDRLGSDGAARGVADMSDDRASTLRCHARRCEEGRPSARQTGFQPACRGSPGESGPAGPLVLVVEDDPAIRELVEVLLLSEGYRVATARDGAEALARIQRESPHLILLDMRTPVMDGWAFARTYREAPGPRAPILVMSASDPERLADQIGAAGHCPKPFHLDLLIRLVREHVMRR